MPQQAPSEPDTNLLFATHVEWQSYLALNHPDLSNGRKRNLPNADQTHWGELAVRVFTSSTGEATCKHFTIGDVSFWASSVPGPDLDKIHVFTGDAGQIWVWKVRNRRYRRRPLKFTSFFLSVPASVLFSGRCWGRRTRSTRQLVGLASVGLVFFRQGGPLAPSGSGGRRPCAGRSASPTQVRACLVAQRQGV